MTDAQQTVRIAVVTGGHCYNVPPFHDLFRSLEDILADVQHLDDYCSSSTEVRRSYDAIVFYIMMTATPSDEGLPWYAGKQLTALTELGELSQGIVLLHHAILAYPDWPKWQEIVGFDPQFSGYRIGETIRTEIADPDHPITRGVEPWEMIDETYQMMNAGEGCHVLLTCDHPRNAHTLAWTRQYRGARVFCYQSGHDDRTWVNPSFREVLRRGILWTAGRI